MTSRSALKIIRSGAEVFRMGQLLDTHILWLKSGGRSPRTIEARLSIVGQYERSLNGRPVESSTEDDLVAFLMNDEWSAGTRRTYRANLAAFFAWLARRGLVEQNPCIDVARTRLPHRAPRPVPQDEFDRAVVMATTRTQVFLMLARYCGLRAVEIANLERDDIDLEGRRITVLGKGGKVVTMRLPHSCVSPLREWLAEHVDTWDLTASDVSSAGNYALKSAGSTSTFHACRHAFAMDLYDSSGGNLSLVSRALRHSSVATTAIYAEARDSELDAAMDGMGRRAAS
jgi:integrase